MNMLSVFRHLPDEALLAEVTTLAERERGATADLIASLAELDARRLYLGVGCSSLFTYCTQVLRLSEHAAYARIEAARLARRFPVILELLRDAAVTLTTVSLIGPHLTPENHEALLLEARHKSKREVEHLVAALRPQPDVPSSVRKLPTPKWNEPPRSVLVDCSAAQEISNPRAFGAAPAPAPARPASAPSPTAAIAPLAPERYKMQFTVGKETYDKFRRVQDLLRHAIPDGDPAAVFDRALSLLLDDLERTKLGATNRPRISALPSTQSRHVPAAVKRAVWKRDGGRCAFVGTNGRCDETGFLEFHHVVPYAVGGRTSVGNLQLRCRAHNQHEREQQFGPLLFLREERRSYWRSFG